MARIQELDLTFDEYDWREAPMPGANSNLDLVRLESSGSTFAILGRFPAGFERLERGGYQHAEEFIVLDGYLELEGERREVGDLTIVPANFLRTRMLAPVGCTVLAWFGGPAIFHKEAELGTPTQDPIVSVSLADAVAGEVLATPQVVWTKHDPGPLPQDAIGDAVDIELSRWQRLTGGQRSDLPYLTRIER